MMRFVRNLLSSLATLILSLILAIIIWISATQAEDPTIFKFLQVPIEFIGQPSETKRVLPTGLNQSITLTVQGRASIMDEVDRNDFTAVVDLSTIPLGEDVAVDVRVQQSDSRVSITSQSPEQIIVHLEPLVTRDIPVIADIRGSVARGYSRGNETINPQQIAVTGTASEVETLDFAQVTVIMTDDDRQTKVVEAQPVFYDVQGQVVSVRNLQLNTRDVEVTVPIREAADFAEKIITADIVGQPAPGYRTLSVRIDPPSVLVQGRPTQLNALSQVKTETIDITGLTESFFTSVTLELPNGVEMAEFVEITVAIEIEPFTSARTYNKVVEPIGLAQGMEATITPETVLVVLFGPSPVLDALAEDEISVTVDLFGLEPGVYTGIEPVVAFPDRGIELRSIQPTVVTASISETLTSTSRSAAIRPVSTSATAVTSPSPASPPLLTAHIPATIIHPMPSSWHREGMKPYGA